MTSGEYEDGRRCDRIAVLAALARAGVPLFEGCAFPCGTVHTADGVFPLIWFATAEDVADAHKLLSAMTHQPGETAASV